MEDVTAAPEFIAGTLLASLHNAVTKAAKAGFMDTEDLQNAYGALHRLEHLERARFRENTPEEQQSLEERLQNPKPREDMPLENARLSPPADETELIAQLADCLRQSPWVHHTLVKPSEQPYTYQHLLRVQLHNGTVLRLGISHAWEEDLLPVFDSMFPSTQTHSTGTATPQPESP